MNKAICGVLVATLLSSPAFAEEEVATGVAVKSAIIITPDNRNLEVQGGLYFDHKSVAIISNKIVEMQQRDEVAKAILESNQSSVSPAVIGGVALGGVALGIAIAILVPKMVSP